VLVDGHREARITSAGLSSSSANTLCLGEALVDMVGERQGAALSEMPCFSPHFGGVAANVALVAARAGAGIALAGGAGDDPWGRWLRSRLRTAGVDISLFELRPGEQTALAFVTVDGHGEPTYVLHGDGAGTIVSALEGRLESTVRRAAALFISTNTLVGVAERELTMAARELALGLGRPVIFEANLRLHRWPSAADATAEALACVEGALLVRANQAEAQAMTGEGDPERAAAALVAAGAELVVVTLGAEGAILRGALRAAAPGVACRVVNTAGAGDVLTGTLLAALARDAFARGAVAAALPEAVAAAARACEKWGAVD
jgi:sugar/nucleoside kinase (ribokinase family)